MKDITPIENSTLFGDACTIIEQAQHAVYHTVNVTLIMRNWLLGMRIHKEVLKEKRAEYGEQVLMGKYFQSLTGKSNEGGNCNTKRTERNRQ